MIHTLERFLEWGGVKKAVTCLVFSGIALLVSIFDLLPQLPFDAAWAAVVLCGIPIILEAVIGLVTAFDIKADVLVSIALIASLIIGEDFAAGEVAFIMQLGALLEDLTVPGAGRHREAGASDAPDRPPPHRRPGGRSFPPSRWLWATCSGCCRARPCQWTERFSPDRPPSTRQ